MNRRTFDSILCYNLRRPAILCERHQPFSTQTGKRSTTRVPDPAFARTRLPPRISSLVRKLELSKACQKYELQKFPRYPNRQKGLSAAQRVYVLLRQRIVEMALLPGERIVEKDIAQEFAQAARRFMRRFSAWPRTA